MSKVFVTMGGSEQGENRHVESGYYRDYNAEAERLVNSVRPYFDHVVVWNNELLKATPFYQTHQDIMTLPSFGWLFKPFEIFEALRVQHDLEGDGGQVWWADSSHFLIDNPQPLFDLVEIHGIYVHNHVGYQYRAVDFTQPITFVRMGFGDDKAAHDAMHLNVNIMGFLNVPRTREIVGEWLGYCSDYETMVSPYGTQDHRWEQSIMSIICYKYKIQAFEFPLPYWREEFVKI